MEYDKLLNYLERKTADTHELQAASAIVALRQRVAELEKERDEEIARNRPLRNLIASLEEQKSHWNKKRNENREAVSTLDSEREANALLTAERDALIKEVAHWKNNHATEVRRARILKERTDMPIERVQAYEQWGNDMAERDSLKQQRDELLAAIALTMPVMEAHAGDKRKALFYAAIASVKEK